MTEPKTPGNNWPIILTLVISAFGILFFVVQAFSLGVLWLISLLDPPVSLAESTSFGLLLWTSILGAVLLIPLLLISINQLRGSAPPAWLDANHPAVAKVTRWVILAWPLVVLLGWFVSSRERLAMFFLGPINVLVAGLPILWVFQLAQSGLAGGTQIRKWRIFGFSIALLPIIIIVVELIALVAVGGLGLLWVGLQVNFDPQFQAEITNLASQVEGLGQNVEAIITFLEPLLLQPTVLYGFLAVFGGIIPIIEEVFKPVALWTLAGRKLTPQEGFVGGLLCGAGFALMENVFYFTTVLMAEDWLFMAIGRAGTGVLHMLASGLVGWGLAKAWQDGKWALLGFTTLGAFGLHGLWNVLALVSGMAPLLILDSEPSLRQTLLYHSPVVLLLVVSVLWLAIINRHLRTPGAQGVVSE
jgi:hypothetical protein